jgi:hypothetical protein
MVRITCNLSGQFIVERVGTQDALAFESRDEFDWAVATSGLSSKEVIQLTLLAGTASWFGQAVYTGGMC